MDSYDMKLQQVLICMFTSINNFLSVYNNVVIINYHKHKLPIVRGICVLVLKIPRTHIPLYSLTLHQQLLFRC